MKYLREKLEIASEAGVNLNLWGRHGVGKTTIIEDWCKEKGYHLETIILSLIEPVIIGGLPSRADGENGEPITVFAKPEWLLRCENAAAEGKRVVIFLDEFNRADIYARNAAMNFLTSKRVHNHELPEGTLFFAACNPEEDTDAGVNEIEDPLVDRFVHVPVTVDEDAWLDWAKGANVNSLVTGFIGTNPDALNAFELDFAGAIGNRIAPTPRSTVYLGKLVTAVETLVASGYFAGSSVVDVLGGVGFDLLKGAVGLERADQFLAFAKDNFAKPFTADEILNYGNDEGIVERVTAARENQNNQLLIASLDTARGEIAARFNNDATAAADALEGVWNFLRVLPVDVVGGFFLTETTDSVSEFWNTAALEGPTDIQDIILNESA